MENELKTVAEDQKIAEGLFEDKNISSKKLHSAGKNRKGDLSHSTTWFDLTP